jgi:hypothetical protein
VKPRFRFPESPALCLGEARTRPCTGDALLAGAPFGYFCGIQASGLLASLLALPVPKISVAWYNGDGVSWQKYPELDGAGG